MTSKILRRDRDLLAALSTQVTILSFEQVARGWFNRTEDPKGTVARRLRALAKDNHLHVFEALSGPEFEFEGPLVERVRGSREVDTASLAEVVKQRESLPAARRRFVATSRAKAALISDGPIELVTHELNFAALFLQLRAECNGWKAVPGASDPRFTAATDAAGNHIEVASRALLNKLDPLLGPFKGGVTVW